jgi:hypothetical protein
LFGYDRTANPTLNGVIIATIFNCSFACVFAPLIYLHLYLTLKKLSTTLSETTRNLQLMLFKVILLQTIALFIFVILPIATGAILILLQLNWAYSLYIFAFLISLMEFHAFVDYCILLYFTRPYRRYCVYCLKKLFRKHNNTTVNVMPSLS